MNLKFLSLCLFLIPFVIAGKCPAEFKPPQECFSLDDIKDYGFTSKSIETLYNKYVNLLTKADMVIDESEPGQNLFFGGALSKKIRKLNYYGNSLVTFLEIALHQVCRRYGLTGEQVLYCFNQLNLTADYFDVCKQYDLVDCSERMTDYQPLDGICVNPDEPYRGAMNTPYSRLIKNSFDDSIHEVRSNAFNDDLPSARLISTGLRTVQIPIEFESNEGLQNDFLLVYAGHVVRDILKTLKAQTWQGNYGFECCDCDGKTKISQRFNNRHCMPIEIPEKDPVFRGAKCMNYIRAAVTHDNCNIKEASVLNSVSHYMDMDFLYVPGTVKDAIQNDGKFSEDEDEIHRTIIFADERSALFPQFYSLIVVWIKFHNIVVDELKRIHPDLPTEIIFYEARRFVVAVYQNIFYSIVLQLILSERALVKYRLMNTRPCYDPEVDPSVTSEFVAAAGRYFHNFIHDGFIVNFENGTKEEVLLRDLRDETLGYRELKGVLTGLLDRPWNTENIANEPSNYLFTVNGEPGLDLRALDIQTERDFGIGTYCDALYHYNLTNGECIEKFSDFEPFISDENIAFLKYAYDEPSDVDLGVGASMHSSTDGGDFLGDVFDRIIGQQFKNIKCGDPYFYTNAMDKDQVKFLEYFSFKRVLCFTIPDLPDMQKLVFLTPGEMNEIEACEGVFSLEGWKLSYDPENPPKHLLTVQPDDINVSEDSEEDWDEGEN